MQHNFDGITGFYYNIVISILYVGLFAENLFDHEPFNSNMNDMLSENNIYGYFLTPIIYFFWGNMGALTSMASTYCTNP